MYLGTLFLVIEKYVMKYLTMDKKFSR